MFTDSVHFLSSRSLYIVLSRFRFPNRSLIVTVFVLVCRISKMRSNISRKCVESNEFSMHYVHYIGNSCVLAQWCIYIIFYLPRMSFNNRIVNIIIIILTYRLWYIHRKLSCVYKHVYNLTYVERLFDFSKLKSYYVL